MSERAILALDQGTTNTKALLIGEDGAVIASASHPTGVSYPREGWAEQSAAAIWTSSAAVLKAVAAEAGDRKIVALGVANQRESVVVWNAETGASVGPCVIWQCLRSAPLCADLREAGHAEFIHRTSGLPLGPLFSAGKLRWLLDNAAGAGEGLRAGSLRAGTVDSWLLWNLTGGAAHATDHSNASRTQLMSLLDGQWSEALCALFGIPLHILPEVCASDSLFGRTATNLDGIPAGLPIHAMMGDSHAALFGHGIERPGGIKVTLGTGSSLMAPVREPRVSLHGLSGTVAWSRGSEVTYALEGNILVSGHAAAFAAQLLGLRDPDELTKLALTVADNGGVCLVPALAGLGAPHLDDAARGLICGLSLATKPGHVARAALEAIALQIDDVLIAMEHDIPNSITALSVDGSAARNNTLMQVLADVTGRRVRRPAISELTAVGVARMAAAGAGMELWPLPSATGDEFLPELSSDHRDRLRKQWQEALRRAKSSANDV